MCAKDEQSTIKMLSGKKGLGQKLHYGCTTWSMLSRMCYVGSDLLIRPIRPDQIDQNMVTRVFCPEFQTINLFNQISVCRFQDILVCLKCLHARRVVIQYQNCILGSSMCCSLGRAVCNGFVAYRHQWYVHDLSQIATCASVRFSVLPPAYLVRYHCVSIKVNWHCVSFLEPNTVSLPSWIHSACFFSV